MSLFCPWIIDRDSGQGTVKVCISLSLMNYLPDVFGNFVTTVRQTLIHYVPCNMFNRDISICVTRSMAASVYVPVYKGSTV